MALNFLVTGVKMLKKSLDKKKIKEGAKKFVGGDKEDKRARVSKIMDKESSYGGGTKIKKPASASKLMNIDIDKVAKTTPKSAKVDYKLMNEKIDNIVGMTDALAFLTGAQSEQKKDELELLRKQREAEKKRKKEAKLEKKDNMLGKIGKGIKKAAQSPLDAITNFFVKMALGALAVFLIANADKIKKIFETIGNNLNLFSKLLRVTIFGFQEGMKLAKAGFKMLGNGAKRLLSPIGKAFKAIGSKITSAFKLLGGKFLNVIKKIPGVGKLTKMVSGAKKTADAAKAALAAKKEAAKTAMAAKKAALKKGFNKVTGGVLKKGLAKAPSRLVLKLFGKNGAKMVAKSGKLFKVLGKAAKGIKIPVLGPIIVAVTSILSGDPLGKTLFKTLGAVFGGMIGGALGAALGGVGAPFGLLLGEIVGEFIGSFLYEMFLGEGKGQSGKYLKDQFMKLLTGAGKMGKAVMDFALSMLSKAGNFFKEGVGRFIENFPTVNISKIPLVPRGLRGAVNKFPKIFGGLEKYKDSGDNDKVNTLPNLGLLAFPPLLLPHFLKSFFPGSKEKVEGEEVPDEVKVSGGEEEGGETAAVVDTPDNSDAVIDDSESGGETTTAQLAESDSSSSSASSSVSDVSSQTTYEESASGTVILGEPSRGNFAPGAAGDSQYKQAMIMYNNQKEMLNSYFKTQVKASLYKI